MFPEESLEILFKKCEDSISRSLKYLMSGNHPAKPKPINIIVIPEIVMINLCMPWIFPIMLIIYSIIRSKKY